MPARKEPTKKPATTHPRGARMQLRLEQINKLQTLARNGWSITQLKDFAVEEFDMKPNLAQEFAVMALDEIVASYQGLDKRRIAALTLSRFENAYRLAASQRNPSAMVAANSQIALHWVHRAPEISVSGPGAVNNVDPSEDF